MYKYECPVCATSVAFITTPLIQSRIFENLVKANRHALKVCDTLPNPGEFGDGWIMLADFANVKSDPPISRAPHKLHGFRGWPWRARAADESRVLHYNSHLLQLGCLYLARPCLRTAHPVTRRGPSRDHVGFAAAFCQPLSRTRLSPHSIKKLYILYLEARACGWFAERARGGEWPSRPLVTGRAAQPGRCL